MKSSVRLDTPTTFANASRCESRFVQDGHKVTVNRSLKVQRTANLCGVGQSRDWLALYKVLQRDLRSQVIYR